MTEPADRVDRPVAPLMTLSEAAAATGRQPESIRTLIRRGKIEARKGNDGRWLVEVPAEMWRQAGDRSAAPAITAHDRPVGKLLAGGDRPVDRSVEYLSARVAELEAAEAEAKLDAEHWRERAEQDGLARARVEGKLEAAERAHAVETATLRELIAEMRRPWWRRWVG
ncbi:MAG: hypothetical protein ACJ8H8_35440 [Geminicoccaceae bacterium]